MSKHPKFDAVVAELARELEGKVTIQEIEYAAQRICEICKPIKKN